MWRMTERVGRVNRVERVRAPNAFQSRNLPEGGCATRSRPRDLIPGYVDAAFGSRLTRARSLAPLGKVRLNDRASERPRVHAPVRSSAHSGFTLIEILVVITVIAILAGLVAPEVFRNVGDARTTAAKAQMESISLALDTYRLDNLNYPSTAQGLAALNAAPTGDPVPAGWRGPYMRRGVPNDPWGRPYIYRNPGTANPNGYDLLTYGRDGVAGGNGEDADITSWDTTAVRR